MSEGGDAPAEEASMSKLFPHLFTPLRLRGHTLRNRIVFGAHTANMARDGVPGEQHAAYYAERATAARPWSSSNRCPCIAPRS